MFLNEPGLKEVISEEEYLACEACYFTYDTASPYERLDYIFYTEASLKCLEAKVVSEAKQISDHLPVYARFTFK